jgi:hypothetical protein
MRQFAVCIVQLTYLLAEIEEGRLLPHFKGSAEVALRYA